MSDPELEGDFPGLIDSHYELKSPKDPAYNCVSFAVGDLKRYWDDVRVNGYYWPPGAPSSDTLDGWVEVFSVHGYRETDDATLESEYEKIAIYGKADTPEHVARQKASGVWASKLGPGKDIEHRTLAVLEGAQYGKVVKIMKRKCQDGRRVLE